MAPTWPVSSPARAAAGLITGSFFGRAGRGVAASGQRDERLRLSHLCAGSLSSEGDGNAVDGNDHDEGCGHPRSDANRLWDLRRGHDEDDLTDQIGRTERHAVDPPRWTPW